MKFPNHIFHLDERYDLIDVCNLEGTEAHYIGPKGDIITVHEDDI